MIMRTAHCSFGPPQLIQTLNNLNNFQSRNVIEKARCQIATWIGAVDPENIVFTSGKSSKLVYFVVHIVCQIGRRTTEMLSYISPWHSPYSSKSDHSSVKYFPYVPMCIPSLKKYMSCTQDKVCNKEQCGTEVLVEFSRT